MKIIRTTPVILFLLALSAVAAFAQAPGRTTTPAAPAANGPVPEAKIALINTAAFFDETKGITRLVKALDGVDREFEPKKAELQTLANDINKRTTDLQNMANGAAGGAPVDQDKMRQLNDQLEQLKKDYQRKGQDAQDAFKRRNAEVQGPIFDDILKSLDAFAKQRGITLTLDGTKLPDAILTMMPSIEITDEFVKDYNSHNPATASLAKPQ